MPLVPIAPAVKVSNSFQVEMGLSWVPILTTIGTDTYLFLNEKTLSEIYCLLNPSNKTRENSLSRGIMSQPSLS